MFSVKQYKESVSENMTFCISSFCYLHTVFILFSRHVMMFRENVYLFKEIQGVRQYINNKVFDSEQILENNFCRIIYMQVIKHDGIADFIIRIKILCSLIGNSFSCLFVYRDNETVYFCAREER
jgi:hypothetical protein